MNDANRQMRMQISHDALRVAVQPPLEQDRAVPSDVINNTHKKQELLTQRFYV